MNEAVWMVQTKKADFDGIAEKFGIDRVTARIIRNRDITGDKDINIFLNGDLSSLYDPFLMQDMRKAVDIILSKCNEGSRIRIVGDYDIDGVCSVSVLCMALMELGADVDYDIPHRMTDGYGINRRIVDQAVSDGVDTIITCDNGISAGEVVRYAKEKGLTIIVTDHHDIPYDQDGEERIYKLPEADAVIDHKQSDCPYPYKELCGAGISFKLACALGVCEETKRELLKLAAFATIGDVVELHDENRIIVKYGLEAINEDEGGFSPDIGYRDVNEGLQSLIKAAGLDGKRISSYHIGFVLGPCVNAAGRLASAKTAAELFLCEGDTAELSLRLKEYNEERKHMTEEMTERAANMILAQETPSNVLVLHLPDCHEAVAGIVAGRIKEMFYKPAFVVTDTEGDELKGSGRSIEGYHMYDELSKCKNLLTKFGGHEMAAGFSLKREDLEKFRETLNTNETLTEGELTKKIWIDVPMPMGYVSMGLVEELDRLEPFGTGNPKPVFADKGLTVVQKKVYGERKNVVKMGLRNPAGKVFSAIFFKKTEQEPEPEEGQDLSVLYYPQINEYMGNKSLQFMIEDFRPQ